MSTTKNKSQDQEKLDVALNEKMPLHSKIAYTFGAFGNDVFYFTLSLYLINFITGHLFDTGDSALNAQLVSAVTLIIMCLRILELIIDPFIGNAIDRTRTKWGHFRPWVVVGGIISSVILCILFTNMGGLSKTNPWLYLAIFAVLYLIMDVFYSFKDIGFWSMLPALTFDSREREMSATMARVGSTIGGTLVGVVVMPVVLFFSLSNKESTGDNTGWFMFGFLVALVALITALGVGFFTREKENKIRENKKGDTQGVVQVFRALIKNDQLMWVAIAYVCVGVAQNVVNSLMLYYFQYIQDYKEGYTIVQTINMFLGVFSVCAFPPLTKKFKRKPLFLIVVAVEIVALVVFALFGASNEASIFACVLFYAPQPIIFLIVLMTITDSVEYGQWKNGHRDESLALSVRPLVDKFAGAVSNGVVGQIAVICGMITGATAASISPESSMTFKLIMFAAPVVFYALAMLLFHFKITLTEDKHAEIMKDLEKNWHKDN